MPRYRLVVTPDQEWILLEHCRHARYVWNLCMEQESHWRPGRGPVPGLIERNLTRSARGTTASPGQNVAAKSALNDRILRAGWGLLVRRLEDKAPGRVEKVPPAYTSQRCSACGHVDGRSRESQAAFRCTSCGYACNADVNAARNIAAGHAVTARGGDRATGPAKREPQLLAS
jgi:putative transposase